MSMTRWQVVIVLVGIAADQLVMARMAAPNQRPA
jgi:hypothetical protein